MTVLRFISEHNDKVIGILGALFLFTCVLLLVRTIGQKEEAAATLDLHNVEQTIEGTLKRVLAAQGPATVVVSGAPPAAGANVVVEGGDAEFAAALRERESTIAQLTAELEKLKAAGGSGAGASGDDGGGKAKIDELANKVAELQARLTEYEIIEDDIADLSLFKDENVRLKAELEALRTGAMTAPPTTGLAAAAPPVPAAPAEAPAGPKLAPDQFILDPNDDVMKQFAAAIEDQKAPAPSAEAGISPAEMAELIGAEMTPEVLPEAPAVEAQAKEPSGSGYIAPAESVGAVMPGAKAASKADGAPLVSVMAPDPDLPPPREEDLADESPLGGTLDTSKMLSEVELLSDSPVPEDDVLEETLDTDKLLAEVDQLNPDGEAAPLAAASHVAPVTRIEPAIAAAKTTAVEISDEDDLLAEFKDSSGS